MKPIPSSPDYKISEDGLILKGDRIISIHRKGSVRASINKKFRLVAEILAETYLGMPLDGTFSVIYLDGNNMNVTLDNILIVDKCYTQIIEPIYVFNGEKFYHINCIKTKQYYISRDGKILNYATKKLVKSCKDSMGYFRFAYSYYDGIAWVKKTSAVHILVYLTLNGFYDKNNLEINHIDGNKSNNDISNLEAVNHTENMRHAVRNGLIPVKYNDEQIGKIISMLKDNHSWLQIHNQYLKPYFSLTKIQSYGLLNSIVNGKNNHVEKCEKHNFIKGSTTRAKRSYTTS